jgi:hypothetical protein
MSVIVCLASVEFHLDFWPHPAMVRPPFRVTKFADTSVRIVAMKGPPRLSEMAQNVPDCRFEGINFFPVGFGSSSNSGVGWRNSSRIGLFACPNSRAFRYSSRRGKATGSRICGCKTTCGHQQLSRTSHNSSSHKSSPKRKPLIGFFESQRWCGRVLEGPRIRTGEKVSKSPTSTDSASRYSHLKLSQNLQIPSDSPGIIND